MHLPGVLAVLAVFVGAASGADRIAVIDWYGYGGLDLSKLREALAFHEGDPTPADEARSAARDALQRVSGRAVRFALVCCLKDADSVLFVGLAEPGAPEVVFEPRPAKDVRLPEELLALFRQTDKDENAALRRGASREDDSQGYSLPDDPVTRAGYLKIREWARGHTATIFRVLETSRYDDQREYAARALGYADASPEQVAALVRASFDSNDGVRDEAIRALGVLCNLGPKITSQIPANKFLPLLHSLVWTDRNKAMFIFVGVTAQRDPAALAMLRENALTSLKEMAQWKDWGHAASAATLVGRIGGIDENRLMWLLAQQKVAEILRSVQ